MTWVEVCGVSVEECVVSIPKLWTALISMLWSAEFSALMFPLVSMGVASAVRNMCLLHYYDSHSCQHHEHSLQHSLVRLKDDVELGVYLATAKETRL